MVYATRLVLKRLPFIEPPMCRFLSRLGDAVQSSIYLWSSLQIELQGQYSVARLDELLAFTRQTSGLRAVTIALLMPLVCAIVLIVPDIVPLRPPTGGIANQSAPYWMRTYGMTAISTVVIILQIFHASSRLPMTKTQLAAATVFVTTGAMVVNLALHLLIGFPTPFVIVLNGPAWQLLLAGSMWVMWKTQLREDPEVRRDLRQFAWVIMSEFAMVVAYPVMIFVFGKLSGLQQTMFSIAFPILKLLLKNWVNRGVYRLEDLAPVYVVLSVDVFHALLLSCAIQSAGSRGTLISVMATDVFQSVVAVVEVQGILKRLQLLHLEMLTASTAASFLPYHQHIQATIISTADALLTSHPEIRCHPSIALPRHLRQTSSKPSPTRIIPVAHNDGLTVATLNVPETNKQPPTVESVRLTLKLLHMVEFYVLIEFVEVIVAVLYAIYLTAMFHLPNRVYYVTLKSLTHDQFKETVGYVLQYAALELFSLFVLIAVFDRLLGISTLRLLAFTLRKHALLAQSLLVFWVFLATQLSLEHYGVDYTFRFEWLRHPS